LLTVIVKIATKLERIEVMLLHAVWSRDLASFIDVLTWEHSLVLKPFHNIATCGINQVASFVDPFTKLIDVVSILIL
jgi:hypothetical protein